MKLDNMFMASLVGDIIRVRIVPTVVQFLLESPEPVDFIIPPVRRLENKRSARHRSVRIASGGVE